MTATEFKMHSKKIVRRTKKLLAQAGVQRSIETQYGLPVGACTPKRVKVTQWPDDKLHEAYHRALLRRKAR